MSGPKVVRIVTREEIEARCRRLIATVEAEVETLRTLSKRLDLYDDQCEEKLQTRLASVRSLMQRELWIELQKQVPQQIEFVRAEASELRERAVAAAAARRRRSRQIADTARSLLMLNALAENRTVLKEIGERALQADETELSALEQALTDLAKHMEYDGTKDIQSELVKALMEDQAGTAQTWSNKEKQRETDRLDSLLAEIEIFADTEAAEAFRKRADEIRNEERHERLALLIDSLTLDASKYVRTNRDLAECRKLIMATAVQLRELRVEESADALAILERGMQTDNLDVATESLATGQAVITRVQNLEAANSRRQAVLSGLAALGYEVTEGMSTAWVKDGRIVVKKPGQVDYGVEFGAPASIDRFQVRLVGSDNPNSPRSIERDRDAETIWCNDFDQLKESLGKAGTTLVIERALGIGAEPVKTVSSSQLTDGITDTSARQDRSLT